MTNVFMHDLLAAMWNTSPLELPRKWEMLLLDKPSGMQLQNTSQNQFHKHRLCGVKTSQLKLSHGPRRHSKADGAVQSKEWILLPDNAPSCNGVNATHFSAYTKTAMLYHPSYSPDQTLVKYSLFPN
jgi:hypothetical protein